MGVCVIDEELTIHAWNSTLEEWTGRTAVQLIGGNLGDHYPELRTNRKLLRLQQVIETGIQTVFSATLHKYFFPIQRQQKGCQSLMIQKTIIKPFYSDRRLALVIIDDVSIAHMQLEDLRRERKRLKVAEQQAENRADELARSNADLEQYAYVASHDLQEPLRKVVSFCELLHSEYGPQLDKEANQYIDFAVEGASRMKQLVTDLLAFSRIDVSNLIKKEVDTAESCHSAVYNLQRLIEETQSSVNFKDLPTLRADAIQLTQLFQNLIGNAIKYRKEEVAPVINVSAAKGEGEYIFCVSDNGIGIAEEHFEKIFAIFQRLHGRSEYSGTGIGLGICKRIVGRLGGRIWVRSSYGVGSQFYFSIPVFEQEQTSPAPVAEAATIQQSPVAV